MMGEVQPPSLLLFSFFWGPGGRRFRGTGVILSITTRFCLDTVWRTARRRDIAMLGLMDIHWHIRDIG